MPSMQNKNFDPQLDEANEKSLEDDPDYQCGVGYCRIPYLQRFANASGFTAFFVLPVFASQTLTTYINSQVPTLERQFGLSSYESGIIMTFNDFGFLFVGLLVASIPKLVHIPRWLFTAVLIFALSGFLCSLPHFIIQSENSDSRALKDIATDNRSVNTPHFPLCADNSMSNATDADKDKRSSLLSVIISPSLKSLSIGLIGIGMGLQGAAKSLRTPFLTQYLDSEDKQKTGYYLGIITSAAIFGPAVAYAVGGLFSQIYVTLEDVDMSKKDPRWIGAWWLGFFVFGIFALCVAFPVVCFPRKLAEKRSNKDSDEVLTATKDELKNETSESIPSKWEIFKERALSYVRVLRSPVYVCMVVGAVLHLSSVLGPTAFKSKYIEAQFGIPLWKANLMISGLMVVTVSCGAFFGGLFTKKVKLSPRMLIIVVLILHTGQIVFHGGLIFIGCRQPEIVGPEKLQAGNSNITIDCNCDPKEYFPVCGTNGINYHSPCYGGCQDAIRNGRIYQNCTMIPGGQASAGLCSYDCNTLIPYLILNVLGFASGSLKIMPLFIATVRSVEDRDKSTAAGLKSVAISVLALIPAPIVFGRVIDKACIIWNTNSRRKGACSLYNIEDLRYGMFSTVIIYKAAALVVFSFALWKVWSIKDWTDLSIKKENLDKRLVLEKAGNDKSKNGNVTETHINGKDHSDTLLTTVDGESKRVPV